MPDTPILLLMLIPSLIVAVVLHEIGHGYVAKLLGDTTASDRGRLTLNPISHVDPIGTLVVPGVLALFGGPVFGWAKPVPVRRKRLRNPRFGMMAVALAGPGTNFILAAFGSALLGLYSGLAGVSIAQDGNLIVLGLTFFVLVNVVIGLFNLLPIPPFDGSHIVAGLLPNALAAQWYRMQKIGLVLILGLIAYSWFFGTAWLEASVVPAIESVALWFLTIAEWIGTT